MFAATYYGATFRDKALHVDVGGIKAVTGHGKALHVDVFGVKSVTRHGKGVNQKFFWLEVGKVAYGNFVVNGEGGEKREPGT